MLPGGALRPPCPHLVTPLQENMVKFKRMTIADGSTPTIHNKCGPEEIELSLRLLVKLLIRREKRKVKEGIK